jgi:hypothetical protein
MYDVIDVCRLHRHCGSKVGIAELHVLEYRCSASSYPGNLYYNFE